ncbi:MAG: hypothetical protein ACYTGW_10225 [Planctomycetota bacterium]|jgi:hypothetical protein
MANSLVSCGPDAVAAVVTDGKCWSWATRAARRHASTVFGGDVLRRPRAGDVALFEIADVGVPSEVVNADGELEWLHRGDHVLGVFGNCQIAATLEGRVRELTDLSLMGRAGLVSTVCSPEPLGHAATKVLFLGYALDRRRERINLKELLFQPCRLQVPLANTFLVVGASAGSGEQTALAHVRAGLQDVGLRVAMCKLTASELMAPGPLPARSGSMHGCRDLHDYGFPTTYGCGRGELGALLHTMLADLAWVRPDVVLVQMSGGVLQREVARVLSEPGITRHVRGVLLTATCAASALFALRWLRSKRHRVVAVSGVLGSAPLLTRELSERTRVPVGSADGVGRQLVHILLDELGDTSCINGSNGANGTNGTNGSSGVGGVNGVKGAGRAKGIDGTNGTNVANGVVAPRLSSPAAAAGASAAPASARLPAPGWRRAGGDAGG